jgi:hypothetical protein
MRLKSTLFAFLLLSTQLLAQIDLRLGMGLDFFSSPSMVDYINQSNFSGGSDLPSFSSAVNFSGEVGIKITDLFQLTGDLEYQIYSFNSNIALGRYDLKFNNFRPSLMTYYVVEGKGFNLKFGGGAGIRLVTVEQTLPASVRSEKFNNVGFGVVLRAQGNTALGEKIFANITLDFRYDLNGAPENNGRKLYNNVLREDVNFNQLVLGIKLGISYQL